MASGMLALGLIFQEASNSLDPIEAVIYVRFFSLLGIAFLLFFMKSKITPKRKQFLFYFFKEY